LRTRFIHAMRTFHKPKEEGPRLQMGKKKNTGNVVQNRGSRRNCVSTDFGGTGQVEGKSRCEMFGTR